LLEITSNFLFESKFLVDKLNICPLVAASQVDLGLDVGLVKLLNRGK